VPPDDFIELVRRAREGRLRIYLGAAVGVGKTYRMLQDARELARRGIDVVVGIVETHGRTDTTLLATALEQVPLRTVDHHGAALAELDTDAVKRRRPGLVLIDEVAHSNAPGGAHPKRYEDVLEVLDAGIHVWCTLNIQHLQSLNDEIARGTGIRVTETVPDAFLARADQIVHVDLAIDELVQRFETGRIYPVDQLAWARAHFFRRENLELLRALALREVRSATDRATSVGGGAGADVIRLVVCFASRSPWVEALLRRAARIATSLGARWFALYIETPAERSDRIDATTQRHLFDAQELARSLGAEVHHVAAEDPVEGILGFARAHRVTDIVIGVSDQPWYKQMIGATVPQRLVRRARDFDLHLLSFGGS
jgi:two-component system sensor histidine kinase KdpD